MSHHMSISRTEAARSCGLHPVVTSATWGEPLLADRRDRFTRPLLATGMPTRNFHEQQFFAEPFVPANV